MIRVEGLTKRYGDLTAIDEMTFRVARGEVVAFLGPNGAGKSTTMRILTGFLTATSGTVSVDGFDVFTHPMEVKARIGYMPEHPPLYNDMTVLEFLKFMAKIKGVARPGRKAALERTLLRCGLEDVRERIIGKLSKGYKRRVGLAQALINDPAVLILDEPTLGLDPKQIVEIRQLIRTLAGRHTIILSTHLLQEAAMICERVLIISQGRIVADDTLQRLTDGESLESVFLKHTAEDVR